MGYYSDKVSSLIDTLSKAKNSSSTSEQHLNSLLVMLESSSGTNIEKIKEDVRKYIDSYNKISELIASAIDTISSNATEFDGWVAKYPAGKNIGSYTDIDGNKVSKIVVKTSVDGSGLTYIRSKKMKAKSDGTTQNIGTINELMKEMSSFSGGTWQDPYS